MGWMPKYGPPAAATSSPSHSLTAICIVLYLWVIEKIKNTEIESYFHKQLNYYLAVGCNSLKPLFCDNAVHEVVVVIRFYAIFISWIPKWFWIKCLAEANWNDKHRHFFESISQCLCQTVPLRDNTIKCHINWVVFRSARHRKTFSTENKKQHFLLGKSRLSLLDSDGFLLFGAWWIRPWIRPWSLLWMTRINVMCT